jgi:hypothetical protein
MVYHETSLDQIKDVTLKLLDYCRKNDWAGYDPYDALNSRLFAATPFYRSRICRIAATQVLKRLPINIRPLLLISKNQNPKALALFLMAFLKLSRLGLLPQEDLIGTMTDKLVTLRSPNTDYWCWGYSFPWQTRTILVPKGYPNLVCTTFVANALLDVYEASSEAYLQPPAFGASSEAYLKPPTLHSSFPASSEAYLQPPAFGASSEAYLRPSTSDLSSEAYLRPSTSDLSSEAYLRPSTSDLSSEAYLRPSTSDALCLQMAISAAEYIVNELYWEKGDSAGFNYPLPSSKSRVHNANFLGAALLSRVYKHTGDKKFLEPALRAARYSAAKQHDDGSWDYGELSTQRWADNFHTGYNLCALQSISQYADSSEFEFYIRRGFEFYRSHFFTQDSAPKYFHDRTYPIDIHCVAQSIITLLAFKDLDENNASLAQAIYGWTMAHLWDERGYFCYQVFPFFKNRISYMRWSQAWMLLALSTLLGHYGEAANATEVGERPAGTGDTMMEISTDVTRETT